MSLKFHIRVLGCIYIALASLAALFCVVGLGVHASQGRLPEAILVVSLVLPVAVWWLETGRGLYHYRRPARAYAILVAAILMIGLNGLLLFADDVPPFADSGRIYFHVAGLSIGAYTLVVLFLPGIHEALQ